MSRWWQSPPGWERQVQVVHNHSSRSRCCVPLTSPPLYMVLAEGGGLFPMSVGSPTGRTDGLKDWSMQLGVTTGGHFKRRGDARACVHSPLYQRLWLQSLLPADATASSGNPPPR
jgi:hypothetical protein